MTREEAEALILALPQVQRSTSYGRPSFKVGGKFLTRLRDEDESLVLKVGFDEREMLMAADPAVFHLTDHYRSYPMVLARIGAMDAAQLRPLLERTWRETAPKRLQKALGG